MRGTYDSVAMFYLFHCLPGSLPEKAKSVFAAVAPALAPGGVVYGATILGKGVTHNWMGRQLMSLYNRTGIFDNYRDDREGLERCLCERFHTVDTKLVGVVLLFEARDPK